MKSGLKVENLYFNNILTNINFKIKPGTITALLGKSGSGKTTLLKCIVVLIKYSGNISLFDNIINNKNIEEEIKNIGIYLDTKRIEKGTVYFNVIQPLINLDYEEEVAKQTVYDLSKKLGIDNLLYSDIMTLSHAEKKVVSFAQSIIHNPQLILIDNLFESLDNYYKTKIISYLKNIKKQKKSIIIFTTNDSEDLIITDNLIIMNNGKIVLEGPTKEILEKDEILLKNDIELPFISDLSNKMLFYNLISKPIYNIEEMVDEIWG